MAGSKLRNQTSNEFGKVSSKATGFFTIELIQTSTLKETSIAYIGLYIYNIKDDPLVLISRMTFFDLPGCEILTENPEAVRIKQGSTLNKVIISYTKLLKELGNKTSEFVMYDTSTVCTLHKELLGGNSLTIALFCL
jgi:hypothetical protein